MNPPRRTHDAPVRRVRIAAVILQPSAKTLPKTLCLNHGSASANIILPMPRDRPRVNPRHADTCSITVVVPYALSIPVLFEEGYSDNSTKYSTSAVLPPTAKPIALLERGIFPNPTPSRLTFYYHKQRHRDTTEFERYPPSYTQVSTMVLPGASYTDRLHRIRIPLASGSINRPDQARVAVDRTPKP